MRFSHLLSLLVCCMMSLSTSAAPVGSKFFTNRDGLRLHYLEAGHGQETIVLVPGWLMPAAVFRLQLEALGEQFRVLAFDPRSHGQSEISNESHDPARRMADMEDFLTAAGVGDYVLAGWSLGVLESLDFIERKAQPGLRGLILIDNSIGEELRRGRRPATRSAAAPTPGNASSICVTSAAASSGPHRPRTSPRPCCGRRCRCLRARPIS
ncbi:MAG: alpha/beta hydrolase [Dechloromonas sp.]|nr:MAG: alpha/beta hydrolase [Dechloromonas sp.]